jgi:hypothetical protein
MIDGVLTADAPTEEALVSAIDHTINDPKTIAQVLSELPKEEPISVQPKVMRSPSSQDFVAYMKSFNDIMNAGISVNDTPGSLGGDVSANTINALELMFQERVMNMEKLSVPEPLVGFHRASVVLFTRAHRLIETARGSGDTMDDPLKRILFVQAKSTGVEEAAQAYEVEAIKAQDILNKVSLGPVKNVASVPSIPLFDEVFGVRKAHAISLFPGVAGGVVAGAGMCYLALKLGADAAGTLASASTLAGLASVPVSDKALETLIAPIDTGAAITAGTTSFVDCLKKVATDVLKNVLIHRIVQQTILWIQGGYKGAPQFVTDWKGFLAEAGNRAAGAAIEAIAPGFCRSFAPLLRIQIERAYLSSPPMTCTLDQVVANAKAFYDDFSQGGWVGYQEAVLPSGNYFGQLFEGSQIVALQEFAEREAAKADAESSQGFLSTKLCVSYDMLSPFDTCVDRAIESCMAQQDKTLDCASVARASCVGVSTKEEKVCRPGGNLLTTPGSAVGQVVNNALGAPIHRIVNAEDIQTLISAFVESGLNKLTDLIKGGGDDGKPNSRGLLGVRLSTSTQASFNRCASLTGDAMLRCLQDITVGSSTVPIDPGNKSCGDPSHCTCKEGLGMTNLSDRGYAMKYRYAVVAAQQVVAQNPGPNGLDPNNPRRWVGNPDIYLKAVVCEIRKSNPTLKTDQVGDEVGIAGTGDTYQENYDIYNSEGAVIDSREMAICSSVSGDNAYPEFATSQKISCP